MAQSIAAESFRSRPRPISGGCGLLLDVHNLCANARYHHFDASEFVDSLDLTRVVEVHMAGACLEAAWHLLEKVVAHAPHLRGVTFGVHDSPIASLREESLRTLLRRARRLWSRHRPSARP